MNNPPGALCDQCYLKKYWMGKGLWKPCPSQEKKDTIIIATAPDLASFEDGQPFTGQLGSDITTLLHRNKVYRKDVQFSYLIACRLIDDDLSITNAVVRRAGKQWLRPLAACNGRFRNDARDALNYITLGDAPLEACGLPEEFANVDVSLGSFGGFPTYTAHGRKLLATYDNAHQVTKWKQVFEIDINKAFRYFNGKLNHPMPSVMLKPSPADLRKFIALARERKRDVCVDVETTTAYKDHNGEPVFDAQFDILRIISISTRTVSLILPFLAVDGSAFLKDEDGSTICEVYNGAELIEIRSIIVDFFNNPGLDLIAHNGWYYDKQVVDREFGCDVFFVDDTMVVAKLANSDLPKALGYRTRMHTDSPAWKAEHTAVTATNDKHLYIYGAQDGANTVAIRAPMRAIALAKDQLRLEETYRKLTAICVGMHQIGLRINEDKRRHCKGILQTRIDNGLKVIREIAKNDDFNPKSGKDIGKLMYDDWNFPVVVRTDTGERGADKEAILMAMGDPGCQPHQYQFFSTLLDVVNARTEKSNFIDKWSPDGGYVKNGIIYPDYSATGTVGWRMSSSGPNFQNIPIWMRICFEADEGYCFVGADADQLELRFACMMAGAKYYIDAIKQNTIDVHNLTGDLVWGSEFWNLPGAPKDRLEKGDGTVFGDRRDLVKKFIYAFQYKAAPPTIKRILMLAEGEDPDTKSTTYPYVKLKLAAVAAIRAKLLRAVPEFKNWWQACEDKVTRDGYIDEPIWGMRRYFYGGYLGSDIPNFQCQAGGAAIIHRATLRMVYGEEDFRPVVPFNVRLREGCFTQVHDYIGFHVPEDKAEHVKGQLTLAMAQEYNGMPFRGKAKISRNLGK